MSASSLIFAMTLLLISLVYLLPSQTQADPQIDTIRSTAPLHEGSESPPITLVIVINRNSNGSVTFDPTNVIINAGDEIAVLNNDTASVQSVTNGIGPDDPLAGKIFDIGPVPPGGFVYFVAKNIHPGTYPFYSASSSSANGTMTVIPRS